jgi:hypothetical protein
LEGVDRAQPKSTANIPGWSGPTLEIAPNDIVTEANLRESPRNECKNGAEMQKINKVEDYGQFGTNKQERPFHRNTITNARIKQIEKRRVQNCG